MMFREELRRRRLEDRGLCVKECCDKCGQRLGPVRYTRKNESGVWCSPRCRCDSPKTATLKPGRPPKYRTSGERRRAKTNQQRIYRLRPSVEKTACIPSKPKLRDQKTPLSHCPSSEAFGGPTAA
jgi:hypothetical protein